ncbi:MAG: anaerobic ribonucleoside-triphosphate reductase activating protein [Bacilli bacterium]
MKISGMEKLTLLDYPEKTACIIFTQGCDFRCPFCQNSDLLNNNNAESIISEEEVFLYLKKRQNVLDGICISGGEPLLQKDILDFIKKIKALGFKVKLDTNGNSPSKLKELLDLSLIDYVAMDIKNEFSIYNQTAGLLKVNIKNIKESIKLLKESSIDYEFRTTIVKELHTIKSIKSICQYIGPEVKYYLQNYKDSENVLKKGLHEFSQDELLQIKKELVIDYPNVIIRGL